MNPRRRVPPHALLIAAVAVIAVACSAAPAPSGPSGTPSATAASTASPVSPTSPPAPTATARPVVGDGEAWIAFQSLADQFDPRADQDGVEHDDTIFLVRPDGSGLHRLAPEDFTGSEIRPTWSPDGKSIAFIRARFPDDSSELWTINVDGSGAKLAHRCVGPEASDSDCNSIDYPDWAADGNIYFGRDWGSLPGGGPPANFELVRYSPDTGDVSVVHTTHERSIEQSRISPDAERAVYVSYRNLASEAPDDALFVVDLDTGDERRITSWSMFAAYPDWSVKDVIAFNTHDLRLFPTYPVFSNLYTVNPDGTDLRPLTDLDARQIRATQPRWQTTGKALLYTLVTPNPGDPYGDRHIWQMSLDGDTPQLTAGGLVGSHPEPRP